MAQQSGQQQPSSSQPSLNGGANVQCFNCLKYGHMSYQCYEPQRQRSYGGRGGFSRGRGYNYHDDSHDKNLRDAEEWRKYQKEKKDKEEKEERQRERLRQEASQRDLVEKMTTEMRQGYQSMQQNILMMQHAMRQPQQPMMPPPMYPPYLPPNVVEQIVVPAGTPEKRKANEPAADPSPNKRANGGDPSYNLFELMGDKEKVKAYFRRMLKVAATAKGSIEDELRRNDRLSGDDKIRGVYNNMLSLGAPLGAYSKAKALANIAKFLAE